MAQTLDSIGQPQNDWYQGLPETEKPTDNLVAPGSIEEHLQRMRQYDFNETQKQSHMNPNPDHSRAPMLTTWESGQYQLPTAFFSVRSAFGRNR